MARPALHRCCHAGDHRCIGAEGRTLKARLGPGCHSWGRALGGDYQQLELMGPGRQPQVPMPDVALAPLQYCSSLGVSHWCRLRQVGVLLCLGTAWVLLRAACRH